MSDYRAPTVLVAEDDPAILELLVTRLRLAGYHTQQERDGFSALETIRRGPHPSAVILDVNMPRMDGFEVLRRMRTDSMVAHIPVLVLTARRQPDDIKTAIRLGATDYLSKPFNDEQFLARVARLLRRRNEPPRTAG